MEIILFILASMYLMIITWLFYLALMMLKQNKNKLTTPVKVVATPLVLIGGLLDITLNLIVATVLFVELPKEFLFTTRCSRHLKTNLLSARTLPLAINNSFRYRLARIFCRHFLNPFDNNHCS